MREWLVAEGTLSARLAADASRFRERYHSDPVFREKVKARVKEWTIANWERVQEYQARYKAEHREHLLEYWRDRSARLYASDPEKAREASRIRQARHMAKLKASGQYEAYKERMRVRAREYHRRRKAKKLGEAA